MPDGPEVWRWRCARGRAAISCMLKRQAGARTKDSTSSHGTQAVERQRTGAVSGDESVVWPWPLARGLTSGWEIPHGDSFTSRCLVVDAVDPARPRQALHAPCGARASESLDLLPLYVCTARVTVKERSPDGPAVRSGLRTRVRGSLSARRGRGERRGSELDVRVRSRGDWSSSHRC